MMNYIEEIRERISTGEIQEASTDLFEDVLDAVLGNPVSVGKIIIALTKSAFFIRERLFWSKMEKFLNGVCLNKDDCDKLQVKLIENGEKKETAFRLVNIIDRAETLQKISYLINATRCLLENLIDRETYFRICHTIKNTLEEDFLLYAYMPRFYSFATRIKADYLISKSFSPKDYIFIIKSDSLFEQSDYYFVCCSTFEQTNRNYAENQRQRTVLKKERINISTGDLTVLYNRLNNDNI